MKRTIILLLLCSLTYSVGAQEVLLDLSVNPVLMESKKQLNYFKQDKSGGGDTLSLPFIDDFSAEGPYPDANKWVDQHVYINNDMPIAPISIGVATFDGLDSSGYPYNFSASTSSSGIADYLTSQPIDLSYTVDDSLYISFYYQPEGRGNAPERKDSLVLEFKLNDSTWVSAWNQGGTNPTAGDSTFYKVMIPIKNTAFLYDGFQFRFKNYATLSGSIDHWHLDYVHLDKGRSALDDWLSDVTFVYAPSSMLKDYSAMPWKHYASVQMASVLSNFIRNNDSIAINTDYQYHVYDNTSTSVANEGGTDNIDPFEGNGYSQCTPACVGILNPPVNFTFAPNSEDSAEFIVEHTINPNNLNDLVATNDTVRYYQRFYNYYAYDDGTAEAGYGLSATGGALAVQFSLDRLDTLRGIKVYFNPQLKDISTYTFMVTVWDDNNGMPGNVLFQDTIVKPVYTTTGPNSFFNYLINKKDLTINGKYYVGMVQTLEEPLNVGFDRNTNKKEKIFYNIDGVWYNTNFNGALMIRPMFGKDFTIGIEEPVTTKTIHPEFSLYPNPAKDLVVLTSTSYEPFDLQVTDLYGRLVLQENKLQHKKVLEVSNLAAGTYLFTLTSGEHRIVKRIVISR